MEGQRGWSGRGGGQAGNYDCRNRLVQAGDSRYTYDAENHRIGVETDKTITRYVVDSQQELTRILQAVETDKTTGERQATYYTYGKGLLAQEDEENKYCLYHFNHLGSTTLITDETGQVVETFEYNPYGELLDGEIGGYRFLFNGEYGVVTDGNGLYYMRARYYNVDIKRYMNQDVIVGSVENSPSLNRYAYVEGNPVNYLDPFGLEKWVYDSSELHEAIDGANDLLLVISTACSFFALICPPIAPEMLIVIGALGVVSQILSLSSIILYIIDAKHAFELDDEQRFHEAIEGICWEVISIIPGSVNFKKRFDNIVWNLTGIIERIFSEFIKEMEEQYDVRYGY